MKNNNPVIVPQRPKPQREVQEPKPKREGPWTAPRPKINPTPKA